MREVKDSLRYKEVVRTLEREGFGQFFKGNIKSGSSIKDEPAKRLRRAIEHLGDGFKLLGIFLAHRIDLIKPEYCKEFSKIKDQAIGIKYEDIEKTIINDFGRPVNTVFNKMWEKPFESTTLTQTHKAKLINGEIVFVKVIKEKEFKKIKEDIKIAKYLAEKSNEEKIKKIVNEFSKYVKKKQTIKDEITFLHNSAKAYGSKYLPTAKEQLCRDKVLIFTFEKNKFKKEKQFNEINEDIKAIKGEIIILILGILISLSTLGIRGRLDNTGGVIGILFIGIALLIGIKNKIREK